MMGINTNAPVKTNRSSHRSFREQQANPATPVTSYGFRDGKFVTTFERARQSLVWRRFLTCGTFTNVLFGGELS
jgi:hypothetical protein